MQPHVTVLTLAISLAALSALLAMALLWQMHRRYRLQRTGRLGDESVFTAFSALVSVGNVALFVGFLWLVAQSVRSGINPYLGVDDPQICPPRPAQGPWYPCNPGGPVLLARSEVQLMWFLLAVATICYALSVVVLIAGSRAGRRSGQNSQRGAAPSE